jgi:hypothetical protein
VNDFEELIAMLESQGVAEVRARLSQGVWANRRKSWVEDWLRKKEGEHEAEGKAEALLIAMEGNITAQEANKIAQDNLHAMKSAKNAAWIAAIAAIVAALCAVVTYIPAKP